MAEKKKRKTAVKKKAIEEVRKDDRILFVMDFKKAVDDIKDTFASSTTLLMSALTFVAALAWRDFANGVFEKYKDALSGWGETFGLFLYAVIVTLIVVLIVRRLKQIQERVGGESIKKPSKRVKKIK